METQLIDKMRLGRGRGVNDENYAQEKKICRIYCRIGKPQTIRRLSVKRQTSPYIERMQQRISNQTNE